MADCLSADQSSSLCEGELVRERNAGRFLGERWRIKIGGTRLNALNVDTGIVQSISASVVMAMMLIWCVRNAAVPKLVTKMKATHI